MKILLPLFIILVLIISFGYNKTADARCSPNQDWPSAPCYGAPGLHPTVEHDKSKWDAYYDYKGQEFMDEKKQEMLSALRNASLCDWASNDTSNQNYNVMTYYFLNGVISSLDCNIAVEYRYAAVNISYDGLPHGNDNTNEIQYHNIIGIVGAIITTIIGITMFLSKRTRK